MHNRYELTSWSLCIACLYTLCRSFNIIHKYNWWAYIKIITHISRVNIFNDCIRCIILIKYILYQTCIAPHCNMTVSLVQHRFITNVTLYNVLIFMHHDYWAWLYLRIYSHGELGFYFCWYYLYYFASVFSWHINS